MQRILMHMFLHVPDQGFLKPSEHWNLVLFSEYNKILDMFFFSFPTFQFPKWITLNFYFFIHLLYLWPTLAPAPPLGISPYVACLVLVQRHGRLNYAVCVLRKPRKALHIWLDELYLKLEMFKWSLLLLLFLFTAVTLNCVVCFFFLSIKLFRHSNRNFPPEADLLSSRLTFYG